MTEAGQALLRHLIDDLGVHKMEALIQGEQTVGRLNGGWDSRLERVARSRDRWLVGGGVAQRDALRPGRRRGNAIGLPTFAWLVSPVATANAGVAGRMPRRAATESNQTRPKQGMILRRVPGNG